MRLWRRGGCAAGAGTAAGSPGPTAGTLAAAEKGLACGAGVNSVVTVCAAPILTAQRPGLGSSSQPLQETRTLPGAAVARSTTFVSLLNSALQTGPQPIPA